MRRAKTDIYSAFLLPDVFFFTPVFLPGRFFWTVLAVGFFTVAFFVGAFVLSCLGGAFFVGAFFAGARFPAGFLGAIFFPGAFFAGALFAAAFLAGAFFAAAVFAGALGRGEGLAAEISGAVRKSTAALVKFLHPRYSTYAGFQRDEFGAFDGTSDRHTSGGVDRSCRRR